MKKTLMIIVAFAAVLAALLAVSSAAERFRPPEEPEPAAEEIKEEPVITNVMEPDAATVIRFENGAASYAGQGVAVTGGVVTIGYPGTYRVSGAFSGQLVVNCGDFHGAVYIMLEGVSVTCETGPALYVAQCDKTVLYLVEGTENAFRDGEGYVLTEGQKERLGAGIYSADDLSVEGEGSLTVTGRNADGIRTKDALTVTGGTLTVYGADEGLQGSDSVDIQGGNITLYAYGNGISTTKGDVTVSGGNVTIVSAGDGIDAEEDITVSGGNVTATTYGGWENYAAAELAGISADGLKGKNVAVTGGSLTLNTAGDGINGDDVRVEAGEISISAGDDGLHADGELVISGGAVSIAQSYEGAEAERVRVTGGVISAAAENNGVSAGADGFAVEGAALITLTAPCCVKSEGDMRIEQGSLWLVSDGAEAPVSAGACAVTGGTLVLGMASTDTALVLEGGEIPASLLFGLGVSQPAGTAITLADADGQEILAFETAADCGAVLVASGALRVGQTYILTAGEQTLEAVLGEGCTVAETEVPITAAMPGMGGASGGMMPRPGASN